MFKRFVNALVRGQRGSGIVKAVIGVMMVVVVLGAAIPALWPTFTGSADDIAALTQTDAGTTMLQTMWPIALVIIGIGIAAGIIFLALREFGIID